MKKLFNKLHTKHKKGFTLLEMLVVVVIIGVLTAVAVPTYNRVMRQSRVADGLNMLNVLASAQNKYYIQHGQYTDTLSDLNAPIKKSSINQEDRILTTNFEYSKGALRTCVYAESKDGEYIIAKNYKTNAKPLCSGNGCANFPSLVETGDIDALCPKGDDICNKTEAWCISQGYTGINLATCQCTGVQCNKDLDFCLSQNCTGFNPTACQCTGCPHSVCKDGDERWVALAGKTCSPVIQGSTERDRGCGRLDIKQKCLGGVWVDTDEGVCSNQWLIDQCGGSPSNVNWAPKCDCKKDIACKYKGADYNVGQAVYTGYEDDTDGSCKTTSSTSLKLGTTKTGGRTSSSATIRCYMKHLKKVCQEDTTWQDGFDCVDKATICSLNGQVLDENCNCVENEPEPTSCDSKPKPACDGQITDGTNPCGRGSSTSSGTGGEQLYVPCEFLCGYNQNVAYCNEATGEWEGCTSELKTYNPNVPKTQACQGEGAADSACGKRSLISVSCELQTPYNQLNFNVTENYGECTLPEGACWEGATETKVQGGVTYTRTCTNCTWGEWIGQCAETPNPSGSQTRMCDNGDSVMNCGTQTAVAKCDATTNYQWVWDFTNRPCENVHSNPGWYVAPGYAPTYCSPDNCKRKINTYNCTKQSNGTYDWVYANTYSCILPEGHTCDTQGPLGGGLFCTNTCKKARCTGDSVYNSGVNECLISQPLNTGIAFYYGASTTNSSYAGTYGYCSDGNAYIETTCPTQIGCGSSANTSYTPDPVIAVADPTNCSTLTNTTAKYVQRRESTKCTNQKYGGQKGDITVYKCVQGTKEFVD